MATQPDRFLHFLDRNLDRLPVRLLRLERAVYYHICRRNHDRKWNAAEGERA